MIDVETCCALCEYGFNDVDREIKTTKKGLNNLLHCSKERGDEKWTTWLEREQVSVHEKCRVNYIDKKSISAVKKRKLSIDNDPKPTASCSTSSTDFNFSQLCIICGEKCDQKEETRKPKSRRRKIYNIRTNTSWKEYIFMALHPEGSNLYESVKKRLEAVNDLCAVEAKYHLDCYNNFIKSIYRVNKETDNIRNTKYTEKFEKLFSTMENSNEFQWSLDNIEKIIGEPIPTKPYIRTVLQERYGDKIVFTVHRKGTTIVNLKGFGDDNIMHFFKSNVPAETDHELKTKVLKLAAQYIREDIRGIGIDKTYFPCATESLKVFLDEVILPNKKDTNSSETKIVSISHAIMCATRPATFKSSH